MGQVLTNATGLQVAREETPGVLPSTPDWLVMEPNSIETLGAEITTVARAPISKLAQRRKGTVVDLDASAAFEADKTMTAMVYFAEAYLYARAVNGDMTFVGADATGTGFTIPAATADQAAKFQYTAGGPISLVHAGGYVNDANNTVDTVFELSADVTVTDTEIPVAGLTVETAPNNAEVSMAGIRAEAGDLALAVSGTVGTLTSGNNAAVNNIDFTTLGLTPGQRIHVGGLTNANRFGSTAGGSNDSYGSARIVTIATGALTLDKLDATLTASDGTDTGSAGANVAVDLLYGRFVRNVSIDHADYERFTHHIEGSYPNLFETEPPTPLPDPDGFEYVTEAYAAEMTWNMPLTDKATMVTTFVGTDAEEPVDNSERKTGADTPRLPLQTGALNTSADFFRLRVTEADETGISTDFKDLTVVINDNVSPEKILGLLGAKYVNNGNFELDVTGQALFNRPQVPSAIRENRTVSMDWGLRNDDGAVHTDIPSATVGDGTKEFPVNESVLINFTIQAFVDPTLLTSIGMSFFPVYPS